MSKIDAEPSSEVPKYNQILKIGGRALRTLVGRPTSEDIEHSRERRQASTHRWITKRIEKNVAAGRDPLEGFRRVRSAESSIGNIYPIGKAYPAGLDEANEDQ